MGRTAIAQAVGPVVAAGALLVAGCLTIPDHRSSADARDGGAVDGDVATGDAAVACPPQYITAVGAALRYHVVTGLPTTWDFAQNDCVTHGGAAGGTHLIVLSNDAERSALFTTQTVAAVGNDLWIGFSDLKTSGQWLAVTDENTSGYPGNAGAPWATGQPLGTTNQCALFSGLNEGTLYNDACSASKSYICECDGVDADPSNY